MQAVCRYIKNNPELGLRENLDDLMHERIEEAEKRLWIRVILEAVFDLDQDEKKILRDDDGRIVLDAQGNRIMYSKSEDAYKFLSGQDRSLYYLCNAIGVNAKQIVNDLKRLGPKELKRIFLANLTNRGKL
jgi:hypothetical protein